MVLLADRTITVAHMLQGCVRLSSVTYVTMYCGYTVHPRATVIEPIGSRIWGIDWYKKWM